MAKTPGIAIEVELIYALSHAQVAETLRVPVGTTVGEALRLSGILVRYPEIVTRSLAVGVWGKRAIATAILREFDRIEIYRPLIADPKQARRSRARRSAKSKC